MGIITWNVGTPDVTYANHIQIRLSANRTTPEIASYWTTDTDDLKAAAEDFTLVASANKWIPIEGGAWGTAEFCLSGKIVSMRDLCVVDMDERYGS